MRWTPLIVLATITAILALSPHAAGQEAYVLPSDTVYDGISPLVLVPNRVAAVNMTVYITIAGGGDIDVYTGSYYTIARGVPWPYDDDLYAIVLPGLPAVMQVVDYQGIVYLVTVNATARVTWPGGSITVVWRPAEAPAIVQEGTGHVFMATPSGSRWTLYQSPSGWTAKEGDHVRLYAVAFGGRQEVTGAYFYVRVGGGTWTQYLAREAIEWSEGPGGAIKELSEWITRIKAEDPRLHGLDATVIESGGIWYLDIDQGGPGARVDYYARIDWGGTYSRTPESFYYRTRDSGPFILVVDDDTLLYWVSRVSVGVLDDPILALAPHGLLDDVFKAGDALLQAGLVTEHDWSSLASLGNLYIAFPGEEFLEMLGGEPDLVYISGLPPSIPGTVLYWYPYWAETLNLLEDLAYHGTDIVAVSTSLLDIDELLYPGLLGSPDDPGLAGLLGMWYASIAHNTSMVWGSPVHQVATGAELEVNVPGLGIVKVGPGPVVTGWWSYTCPLNSTAASVYDVESPWLSLKVKKIADMDWDSIASTAGRGLESSVDLWSTLSRPYIAGEAVVIGETRIPLSRIAMLASVSATPLLDGCGGGQIYLFHGPGYNAIYATFEPEAGSPELVEWIAEKVLHGEAPPLVNLSSVLVPAPLAVDASALASPPWHALIIGRGEGYSPGTGRYVVVSPRGPVSVEGGDIDHLSRYDGGVVLAVALTDHSRLTYAGGEPFAPIVVAGAVEATTTPPSLTATTYETTTTAPSGGAGENTTMVTTTPAGEEGPPIKLIAGILAAAAAAAIVVILRARERAAYKYV